MPEYAQIAPRSGFLVHGISSQNTGYIYPLQYVEEVLKTTNIPHTYDGVNIVCPTRQNLEDLYSQIYAKTAEVNPGSNPGFSIGWTTLLQDYGREMFLRTKDNTFFIHWRNVKQLTDQSTLPLQNRGNSPNGTVGFITTSASYANNDTDINFDVFDKTVVIRLG